MGFEPRVTFGGPLDAMVSEPVADDVVATLREVLSNIARHARARHVDVELSVAGTNVVLRVVDDGIGFTPDGADRAGGHGLRNMRARAVRLRRGFDVSTGPDGGTVLEWRAELPASAAAQRPSTPPPSAVAFCPMGESLRPHRCARQSRTSQPERRHTSHLTMTIA